MCPPTHICPCPSTRTEQIHSKAKRSESPYLMVESSTPRPSAPILGLELHVNKGTRDLWFSFPLPSTDAGQKRGGGGTRLISWFTKAKKKCIIPQKFLKGSTTERLLAFILQSWKAWRLEAAKAIFQIWGLQIQGFNGKRREKHALTVGS